MQLTAQKYVRPSDFINEIFPEYIEVESIPKSDWLIIRAFYTFISWLIKPRLTLKNLPGAKKLLDAVRRVQASLHCANDEEFNDALNIIVVTFLERENKLLASYIPMNEAHLLEEWEDYSASTFASVL